MGANNFYFFLFSQKLRSCCLNVSLKLWNKNIFYSIINNKVILNKCSRRFEGLAAIQKYRKKNVQSPQRTTSFALSCHSHFALLVAPPTLRDICPSCNSSFLSFVHLVIRIFIVLQAIHSPFQSLFFFLFFIFLIRPSCHSLFQSFTFLLFSLFSLL